MKRPNVQESKRPNVRSYWCRQYLCILMTAVAMITLASSPLDAAQSSDEDVTAFRVGKVITMDADDTVINNAVVIIEGNRIVNVGRQRDIEIPDGVKVIDMPQSWLVPGLVELHNHTAGGLGDLNDLVYLTNPGLRTLETVVPETNNIKRARAAGVTTALLIPGSGTNLTGFGTIVKFAGDSVEEMVVRSPGSLKIAQAGNPERYWYGVGRTMMNYNTRRTMEQARDYHLAWKAFEDGETDEQPNFNPIYHEFRGLFEREFIASVHTQAYQVVMTTLDMLADKLELHTVIAHGTFDAWKTAPLALERGQENVQAVVGPRAFQLDRTQRKIHGIAARWWQGGMRELGVNTDAPVIPQEELPYQAAMGVYYGWRPYEALRGVTIIPARAMRMDERVGSIEVGKDADFGIWTGDPIDPRSYTQITVINGRIVYNAEEDRIF
jgi:imidazolonepropionase-like amidohydrolase